MERKLAIFHLTPEAAPEGSRMSKRLLTYAAAAQRAKSAVANFPSDSADLWKIKMRPEEGYVSLVSFALIIVSFAQLPLLLPNPCHFLRD
jgi:hypothetical protein